MRYLSLKFENIEYTSEPIINNILIDNSFSWLLNCEIEDALIEIKNKTIIWHSGTLYSGSWEYGIWKSGDFYGIFENGIFENGNMKGKFLSGIKH